MQFWSFYLWMEKGLLFPPVYSIDEGTKDIEGGDGQDLAEQVSKVVKEKLDFNEDDMQYVRGSNLL